MAGLFDSGGDSAMTVSIMGDASGASAAAVQAANALASLGPAAEEAAAQANAALSQISPAMQGVAGATTDAMGEMTYGMGGMVSTAQGAFLGANGLTGSAAIAADSMQRVLGSGPSGMTSFFAGLTKGVAQAGDAFGGLPNKILAAINPMNMFHSTALKMVEVMGAWRLMEAGASGISNFVGGIWQLPIQMEKAQGSWQYMFNPERTAGQSMSQWQAQGQGIAKGISDWTQKESINLPYTRQDLISAITSLAPAGLSAQGIEKYLPLIGDIAAAQNPNLSLQQASYSVMGAMMGYSRMLRYDLHINPEQLTQYGYNPQNSATLLPALQAYAQARGITSYNAQGQDVGAAYNISHTTFWGEWSSLIDRVQNTQLLTGGKGPFGELKSGLEWLNAWIDDHSTQIDKFATMLGETLAGGMTAVKDAAGGMFEGLKQSGVVQSLSDAFAGFAKWMSDPATEKNIGNLFKMIGTPIGESLKGIGGGISAAAGGLGAAWAGLGPGGQQGLLNILTIPGMLGNVMGQGLGGAFRSLPYLGDLGTNAWGTIGRMWQDVTGGPKTWGRILPDIGHSLGRSFGDVGDFLFRSVQPIGGIYDSILNWAGYNDKGAGAKWVNNALTATGGFLSGIPGAVGRGVGNAWGWLGSAWNAVTGQGQTTRPDSAIDPTHPTRRQLRYGFDRNLTGYTIEDGANANQTIAAQEETLHRKVVASHEQMEKEAAAAAARMAQQVVAHIRQMKEQALDHLDQMQQGAGKHATQLTQKFTAPLDTLVTQASQRLRLLRTQTDDILSGMAADAGQWGANLVAELSAGMAAKTPEARRAAVNVARQLQANLGFGSPTEEGPGADADTWAPNFIRMFNAGLLQGMPQIMQSAAAIAAAMNPVTAGGAAGAANYAYHTAYGASNVNFHLYGLPPSAVHQVVTQAQKQQDDRGNRILRRPGNYGRIGWIGG